MAILTEEFGVPMTPARFTADPTAAGSVTARGATQRRIATIRRELDGLRARHLRRRLDHHLELGVLIGEVDLQEVLLFGNFRRLLPLVVVISPRDGAIEEVRQKKIVMITTLGMQA